MNQIISLWRYAVRLIEHARANGPRAAALLVAKNLPRSLLGWLVRRRIRSHEQFDRQHGLDTQMPVRVGELETSAPAWRSANRYEGTPIPVIHTIIRRLRIAPPRFTFIDLGSGKGRVLLIASQYPFKRVIGVEFSERLHNIATSNIRIFGDRGLTKTSVSSINRDAGAFDFAQVGDKIIFCYNPFGADLMCKVLDNLELAGAHKPAETIFAYLGAMPKAVADRLAAHEIIVKGDFLSEFGFFEQYAIYSLPG